MRVLKYLKFFEEAELTLGELEKQRGGVKRGNSLIKKLKEPLVELDIKDKDSGKYKKRIIDHIKIYYFDGSFSDLLRLLIQIYV